jgi:NADH:ubiquinone oxidoreductase subunit 5 (subunit L)/multisubunit Na+/H+ antiporter MnhA subunit
LSVFVRLVLLSVILGFGLEIMVIGEGSRIWNNSIFIQYTTLVRYLDHHWMFQSVKLFPTLISFCLMVMSLGFLNYSTKGYVKTFQLNLSLLKWMSSRLYLDSLVVKLTLYGSVMSYTYSYQLLDKGLLDIWGRRGSSNVVREIEFKFKEFHDGYIFISIFWILTWIIVGIFSVLI